jgi:hypothetical protein
MAIVLTGSFNSFCVPDVLYHGTSSEVAGQILKNGMQHQAGVAQSIASRGANYLTTSLSIAASFARSRAFRHGGSPSVISVDASQLNPDYLAFDLNMCGAHWSESIAYGLPLRPEALSLMPVDATFYPTELMLLDEPVPGERPLVFDLGWSRAREFLTTIFPIDDFEKPKAPRG